MTLVVTKSINDQHKRGFKMKKQQKNKDLSHKIETRINKNSFDIVPLRAKWVGEFIKNGHKKISSRHWGYSPCQRAKGIFCGYLLPRVALTYWSIHHWILGWIWTPDPRICSHLLCHLSYRAAVIYLFVMISSFLKQIQNAPKNYHIWYFVIQSNWT